MLRRPEFPGQRSRCVEVGSLSVVLRSPDTLLDIFKDKLKTFLFRTLLNAHLRPWRYYYYYTCFCFSFFYCIVCYRSTVNKNCSKLFNVKSKDVVHECETGFGVFPVADVIDRRKSKFLVKYDHSENRLCQVCKNCNETV